MNLIPEIETQDAQQNIEPVNGKVLIAYLSNNRDYAEGKVFVFWGNSTYT